MAEPTQLCDLLGQQRTDPVSTRGRIIKHKIDMTTKITLKVIYIYIAFFALIAADMRASNGGFNLELTPSRKIARADSIVTGVVIEQDEVTVKFKIKNVIKGKLSQSVISLTNARIDLEAKRHPFEKGQNLLLYLVENNGRLEILQQGYGVQDATDIATDAVKAGVNLLESPDKDGILTKMLVGSTPEIAIALDFLLLEKRVRRDEKSASDALITNLEKLCSSVKIAERRDAACVIGRIGSKASLGSLLKLIEDPHNSVSAVANDAVRFITGISAIKLPPNPTDRDKQAALKEWRVHLTNK